MKNQCITIVFAAVIPFISRGENSEEKALALRFFENKVRPLLSAECYECHGREKAKGGLRLDHITHIRHGGDNGPALVPGEPAKSLLVEAIRRTNPDLAMPPKKELSAAQIATLEKWIAQGAPWPEDDLSENEKRDEKGFTAKDYEWWAIQPVKDPVPPRNGEKWARNEIDRFVSRRLEDAGLQPSPLAGKEELARRAYFDLHGIPPTPQQVEAFVNDSRADAWERLIDELLASPRYGERWAQHWLDVVRYAESDGYRADDFRPETWRYRDYVIASFNNDKPYDQFVREQLAGDELAPGDPDVVIGTAFLRLGLYEWNQRNARMQWDIILTDMTNVTSEAFLGIGIGCAQCHDHKFDPILQKDHYAMQAFLNTVWWPEHSPFGSAAELETYQKKNREWEEATAAIRAEIDGLQKPRLESSQKAAARQFPDDIQKIYWKPSAERTAYEEQLAQLVQRQVDNDHEKINWEKEFAKKKEVLDRYVILQEELKKFDHLKPGPLPMGFVATDIKPRPADTTLKRRGVTSVIEPAFLTLLDQETPAIHGNGITTGRRTALANWIASPSNPLSTRVITNRVWQYHFARGLAPSSNDFGKLGGPPTHSELLDWLTHRFVAEGWSIKKLHRLIMNSATYRQTARREPSAKENEADPGNDLLWRYPPKRLSAEQARDAMLLVSGELDLNGGGTSQPASSNQRAIYTKKLRNTPDAFLASFDAPAGFSSAPDRVPTTTPLQSLLLVNGDWPVARARAFAKQLLGKKTAVEPAMIQQAFRAVYNRSAARDEIDASLSLIRQLGNATGGMIETPPPPPKYPNETGLRDIHQYFGAAAHAGLGSRALWLQPGSRFERLDFSQVSLPEDSFTIEAVTVLENVYKDASVNTLASQWNGNERSNGWAFGVTSEKSRYHPRNLIMQLVGKDFQENLVYEVVASDLYIPLGRPVYIAASISAQPTDGDSTAGKVVFYLRDLADPKAELQKAEVKHGIVGGLIPGQVKSLIGGREAEGHLWDGQLARIRITPGRLSEDQLFIHREIRNSNVKIRISTEPVLLDWDFSSDNGEEPAPGARWYRKAAAPRMESKLLGALTDFCHALLNSNEFLYLH